MNLSRLIQIPATQPTARIVSAVSAGVSHGSVAPGPWQRRAELRLNAAMALTVCCSGLTLSGDAMTQSLAVIACFFALVGLVFVDWLRWFSLPAPAAYLALGGVAIYSLGHLTQAYSSDGMANERQMVVVAELLVLVQAVLMLQVKNRRIYEQITIFCLLELIVASIFNDALSYGLLLVPLGLVGLSSLALLQTYGVVDEIFWERLRPPRPFLPFRRSGATVLAADRGGVSIEVVPLPNLNSICAAGLRLPRAALLIFAPAVLLIAGLFFYGLPRTSATGMAGSSKVVTGFSDNVQLGQVGRMLQNRELAMRVTLWEINEDAPYFLAAPMYLRGNVLERYQFHSVRDGYWQAYDATSLAPPLPLPTELPPRATWPGDLLNVRVALEPSTSDALFAVSPARRSISRPELVYNPERWLLRRAGGMQQKGRITYQFTTNAFRDNRQSRYTPWSDQPTDPNTSLIALQYIAQCLEFDPSSMPSVQDNLQLVMEQFPTDFSPENPLDVAQAIENHFVTSRQFEYSLDQPYSADLSLNPIECFLSQTRSGSCQYFASAMVMMLRAHGIPARMVVGYHTDEHNSIADYYVARQSHAHAWVEALIDRQWVPTDERYLPRLSQWTEDNETLDLEMPMEDQGPENYWVRFDPTPGGGGVPRAESSSLANFFELAQNLWGDMVVYRGNQRESSGGRSHTPVTNEQLSLVRWLDEQLARFRTANLGGGALAIGRQFSWPAALGGGVFVLLVVGLMQLRLILPRPRWRSRQMESHRSVQPSVLFYNRLLELLRQAGIQRRASQTPAELAEAALTGPFGTDARPALRTITEAFYDARFGGKVLPQHWEHAEGDERVQAALESLKNQAQQASTPPAPLPKKV